MSNRTMAGDPHHDPDEGYDDAAVDWFWQVIDDAGQDPERLRGILTSFDKEQVHRFQDLFVELAVELQDEPYRTYLAYGQSEDGVEDVSHQVVSAGRPVYDAALADPGQMAPEISEADPPNLFSVAYEVYYARFGEPLEVM